MIAPDPSPNLTETPACGMNSRNEWTVFRETMSFYGVAHDRLPRVVADSETAVRATVSTSFVPAGADRQIGVWCVPPVTIPACRKPQLETLAQFRTDLLPRILAPHPLRHRSVVDPHQLSGSQKKDVKKQNNTGNYQCALLTSEAI